MNTIEQVSKGCATLTAGDTLTIKGLESSNGTVRDLRVKLLPLDGYKKMQQQDRLTLIDALAQGKLSEEETLATNELLQLLEKSLAPSNAPAAPSGPRYVQDADSPVHRLAASPDAVYFLRLEQQGTGDAGKAPPKGALPLAKFVLSRKLQLLTTKYIHAIKLEDGKFASVEID